MAEKEKSKRKRTPDPWWRFPKHFDYAGKGSVATLIPHLQGYDRYEWRNGNFSIEITEIEADKQYHFVLTYDTNLSSGPYQTILTGRMSQPLPETFIVDGHSTIALSGLENLVYYMALVIFISSPVAIGSVVGGSIILTVLSAPMLLPLFLHLWYRRSFIRRFEQILRHYEVYGPHVVLESDEHPAKRRPLEEAAESCFVFEDGMLKEKRDS